MKKILVTGAAGFIGFHLVQRLLKQGDQVVGIDNLNDYYDPQLKIDRLKEIEAQTILNLSDWISLTGLAWTSFLDTMNSIAVVNLSGPSRGEIFPDQSLCLH